jgi:regulation of enolase protein 1 (concanavalin A-like superfamily)
VTVREPAEEFAVNVESTFFAGDCCPPAAQWRWWRQPAAWSSDPAGTLEIVSPAGTDLYFAPGVREVCSIVALERPISGAFTISVSVAVDGTEFADAGGLLLRGHNREWLKLCVERSKTAWQIVTVASRPASDEAAGPLLDGPGADLLVTREGRRVAAYYRRDAGDDWRFARCIYDCWEGELLAGLFVQAPFSTRCTARFRALESRAEALRDRR